MTRWGLVTTVKAPLDQILAFVAHHLSVGAEELWLFFDDPDDPAFDQIAALPRVTATRCTDAYWATKGGRHDRHQNRQSRNAREAQKLCALDWLGHIDVDEFLHAPRPIAAILGDQPASTFALRMEPFEAIHTPDLPDDIFTARHFRGPLSRKHEALRDPILGPYAVILPKGHLSHTAGKSFCRPKTRGLALRLHQVTLNKEPLQGPFHTDLRLLHFHAQDRQAWVKALPFRLERGAYQFHPAMADHLAQASDAEIHAFYDETQMLSAEKLALLAANDRLITADLGLRSKIAALAKGAYGQP
jgi:Glycosyl transferase family 2